MTTNKPNINPEGLYNQKQAAEALEVSKATIRKWTRLGILHAEVRLATNRLCWSGAELIKFWRFCK